MLCVLLIYANGSKRDKKIFEYPLFPIAFRSTCFLEPATRLALFSALVLDSWQCHLFLQLPILLPSWGGPRVHGIESRCREYPLGRRQQQQAALRGHKCPIFCSLVTEKRKHELRPP